MVTKLFFGRTDELAFLNRKYEAPGGQFVVLYGRRRVGKTELLRQFCKDKEHIFYVCKECINEEQLLLFTEKCLKNSKIQGRINSFSSWENAFSWLIDVEMSGKKLLIIDEFPYMVNGNYSIPSILQNVWDEVLKNENVMLIISGSSMSFVENELLSEKNPLYGRATGIYKLTEFDYFSAKLFFKGLSNEEIIKRYAVVGGMPHYLKQFQHSLGLEENIKHNILSKGSVMYNEVEFLMRQELREPSVYYTLIEAIALGNTKLNDIYMKTQIEKTKINTYLKNLINLQVIYKEYPVTEKIKKTAGAYGGLYKIKNQYFKFYFRYLFPNISELEEGDVEGVYQFVIEPTLNQYVSTVFEDICIQYLRKCNIGGELPFHFSKIGRWWNKKEEIDIVAFDDKKNVIFGECKWKNEKVGIKELEALRVKSFMSGLSNNNSIYFLFSKSGFDDNLIKIADIDSSIKLVTLDMF